MILRVVDEQSDGKIRAREHGSPQRARGPARHDARRHRQVAKNNTYAWTDTPEGKAIGDKAEGQRCSNLASIKLWHVIPR